MKKTSKEQCHANPHAGQQLYLHQSYASDAGQPDRGGGGPPHPGRGAAVGTAEPQHPAGQSDPGGAPKGEVGLCGAPGDEPRPHHRPQELLLQRGAALPADPGKRSGPHFVCYLGLSEGRGQADGQGLGLRRDGPEAVRGLPQGGTGKWRLDRRRGPAVLRVGRYPGPLCRRRRSPQ